MKNLILFLSLFFGIFQLQAQNTEEYQKLIQKGQEAFERENYTKSLKYYISAKNSAQRNDFPKLDSITNAIIDKISEKEEVLEDSLESQVEQIEINEITIFYQAVLARMPKWKVSTIMPSNFGRLQERVKKEYLDLDKIDSLNLQNCNLSTIPYDIQYCTSLRHINLLANPKLNLENLDILFSLPKLESIYIELHDLSDIDSSYWHKITGIKILQNDLKEFPANILTQKQLRYLDLDLVCSYGDKKQNIQLPKELFELENLEHLVLSRNKLKEIPPEIGKLKNLKVLDLWGNEIQELPQAFIKLNQLEILRVAYNKLDTLPKEIGSLKSLKALSFIGNRTKVLPNEIGNLKNLEALYGGENLITKLPETFRNLDKLKTLVFRFHAFDTLPLEITKLKSLEKLVFTKTILEKTITIPKEIGNLSTLKYLDLHENYLYQIPDEIGNLENLQVLSLKRNQLKFLPKAIRKLQNLRELNATYNCLKTIPTELSNLKSLRRINLSDNYLKDLPKEFGKLEKLEDLVLSGNTFKTIPSTITKLKNLKNLDLQHNQIQTVSKELTKLPKVKWINLLSNYITDIPEEFKNFESLKHLSLKYNPIKYHKAKQIDSLLTNYDVSLPRFQPARLLWKYYSQGNLKNKLNEFKDYKEIRFRGTNPDILVLPKDQKIIQKLLPNTKLVFVKYPAYSQIAEREFHSGNYQKSYDIMLEVCAKEVHPLNFSNASWYALFVGEYDMAISLIKKAIELIKEEDVQLEKILALAYLLNNQWLEAKKIYLKWKDKNVSKDYSYPAKYLFLQDMLELEAEGIKHKGFKKVRNLLK